MDQQRARREPTRQSAAGQAIPAVMLPVILPVILGLVIFAASLAGILLRLSGSLSFFWIANAVLLGLMMRHRPFATAAGWAAAAIGYLAADLVTGSDPLKTVLLTIPNLAGAWAGLAMFRRLDRGTPLMAQAGGVLALILIAAAASLAAALTGLVPGMLLFDLSAPRALALWFVTEFSNFVAVLPLMLTLPGWRAVMRQWGRGRTALARRRASLAASGQRQIARQIVRRIVWRLTPLAAYGLSLALEPAIGGPGSLAFPVPALLWCAVTYSVAAATFLTLTYASWVLIVLSPALAGAQFQADPELAIVSLRLGVALAALAPVMVAVIMAERNESLRVAAVARASAEDAMAQRSLLLATMAHELRTPLNSIVGYAALIASEMRGPVGQRQYVDDAASIELAGRHLATLVTDLLDTAKVEAGNIDLTLVPTGSREIVDQAVRLVRGMALEKHVQIVVVEGDGRDGAWPTVRADDRAIKQVLINLFSNAVKFSTPGGEIRISHARAGGRLRISIADRGRGIEAEELARLCRAYAQAGDQATQRQGTGLGLALSAQLIHQHGGKLVLESTPGVGTAASFDLEIAVA